MLPHLLHSVPKSVHSRTRRASSLSICSGVPNDASDAEYVMSTMKAAILESYGTALQ